MSCPGRGNPMRWSCERDGCFNVKCRPKIEAFADCFERRVNFGDVDGQVELGGKFLLLEWKSRPAPLSRGQCLAMNAYTRQQEGNLVLVVAGNAETMEVESYALNFKGAMVPSRSGEIWRPSDMDSLKGVIRRWRNRYDHR